MKFIMVTQDRRARSTYQIQTNLGVAENITPLKVATIEADLIQQKKQYGERR